ncbi:MAG: porin [Thiobacillus sp.]|nr:porin [Thiobacillus sp.]
MKKIPFVLLASLLAAGTAAAQSSVTLFGIVDAAARQVKNGSAGSQKQLASGAGATSRFGFRGVEDLGGGLRAGFHLESGISLDTGTTDAKFWGRRATVSLQGGFGEVRLGRDYLPSFWNTAPEPFGLVGVGSIGGAITYGTGSNLGSPATTVLRADNLISYFLPAGLGGLYGQASVAAGEGVNGNKYMGGRLGYSAGPVNVGVGYGKTDTGTTPDFTQFNVMMELGLGFAKLYALYDVREWKPREEKVVTVGATVPVGSGALKFAYAKADRSGGAAGSGFGNADDATLMAAGYSYDLSKRTTLYTTLSRIANKGSRTTTVSSSGPLTGMRGGETSSGFEAGVTHRF